MDLKPLFSPETIAVIGVSRTNDRHPANVIYSKLRLRYPVKVFPVNPKGGEILRETIYSEVTEIPDKVDLAVIAARAEFVPAILSRCVKAKVGGATFISGGFAEVGRADLQQRLVDIAREADFPFIGPNCLGVYVLRQFDTFFLPGQRLIRPDEGSVGIVSQSGGVLVDQMVKFAGQNVGLSLAVSIGNKAVVRELDLLKYLSQDLATRVIRKLLSVSVQPIASLGNPVDLTGSAVDEDFIAAATGLSASPDIDCVLILLLPYSPGTSSDLGARLGHVYQKEGKPLVAYVPHEEKYRMLIEGFELNRVPVSSSIEGAVLMVEAMRRCQPC